MYRILLLLTLSSCTNQAVSSLLEEEATCRTSTSDLALDEISPLGFAASDLLAILGRSEVQARWLELQVEGVAIDGEDGDRILVDVSHRDGRARFVDREPIAELGDDCEDHLELDVEVRVESPDGALREVFTAPLVSRWQAAGTILHVIGPDAIAGSLRPRGTRAGVAIRDLPIHLELSPFGVSGEILLDVETTTGRGDTAAVTFDRAHLVHLIPEAPRCPTGAFAMPLTGTLGTITPIDVVVAGAGAAYQLAWDGQESAPVELDLLAGAFGCAVPGASPRIAAPASLDLRAPGLDLRLDVTVAFAPGVTTVEGGTDLLPVRDLAGKVPVDLGGFHVAEVEVRGAWGGAMELLVTGGLQADCVRHSQPGESCEGTSFHRAATAALTTR